MVSSSYRRLAVGDKRQVPFITGPSASNWLRPDRMYDDDVDEQLSAAQIKKLQLASSGCLAIMEDKIFFRHFF